VNLISVTLPAYAPRGQNMFEGNMKKKYREKYKKYNINFVSVRKFF
jgi:hypothetical protein